MSAVRVEEHSDGNWFIYVDEKHTDEIQGSMYDAVYQAQANSPDSGEVEVTELDGYTYVVNLV